MKENSEQPLIEDEERPIVLQGLHLAVHTPTEERLTAQIEGLTPEKFAELAVELEDYMETVDEEYKNRETRGRGWKGRGKRVTKTDRRRVLKFSPFPSSFSNVLRRLRRNLYIEMGRQCSVLEGTTYGHYKQNIYILPYVNAAKFMVFLQTLDEKIDRLNKDVELFKTTDNWEIINLILSRYDRPLLLDKQWTIPHISFDVTPLSLDPNVILNMVQAQKGTIADELQEEERLGLERLQQSLQVQYRETVVKTIEALRKELNEIVTKIVSAKKKDPEIVKKELERLRIKSASIGLQTMADSIIEPLVTAINDPDKAYELFGIKDLFGSTGLSDNVNGRITALLESL